MSALPPPPGAVRGALLPRPLLRGWSHAVAVIPAIVATVVLAHQTRHDRLKQSTLLVYGIASVLLFAGSALYHLAGTGPRRRAVFRRIDHVNIFILVAATYTPIVATVLDGAWRLGILIAVWVIALVGVAALALPGWEIPRGVRAACYVGQGCIGIAALPRIAAAAGWSGVAILLVAGALYTLGAVAYSLRWPRLWPRVFGYHEVFHLLVIIANAGFFVFMLRRVVPD